MLPVPRPLTTPSAGLLNTAPLRIQLYPFGAAGFGVTVEVKVDLKPGNRLVGVVALITITGNGLTVKRCNS